MSEVYKQKEWELRSKMEDIDTISSAFEDYAEEVDRFVGYLLNDTKDINVLRSENKRLHSIIKEVREYIEEHRIQNKYSFEYDLFQRNTRVSELLEILDKVDKKDITIPLEELESYESKNIYEEAEQDYFWSKE